MRVILITGGVRSGKSAYAQERAADAGGEAVTVIATARAGDAEMERRIAVHRAQRPKSWETIEAPRDAAAAIRAARSSALLLDCLTLLASNAMLDALAGGEEGAVAAMLEEAATAAVLEEADGILAAAAEREGILFIVTNEVGLGVVPPTEQGRWFRDALGLANQRMAAAADSVVLLVSGIPVRVKAREGDS